MKRIDRRDSIEVANGESERRKERDEKLEKRRESKKQNFFKDEERERRGTVREKK